METELKSVLQLRESKIKILKMVEKILMNSKEHLKLNCELKEKLRNEK